MKICSSLPVCAVSVLVLPIGCVLACAATTQTQGVSADTEEIASLRAAWASALHSRQLNQMVAMYAPDGAFLTPDGQRFTGRPAIRELTKRAMDAFTSDINLHSIAVERSGNLAYDSGEYSETLVGVADGVKTHVAGTYLTIYERQRKGKWLIAEQVWTEASGREDPHTRDVLKEISQYYADMVCRDGEMVAAFEGHFWHGATITTVWQPSGRPKPEVVVTPVHDFVAQAPQGPCSQPIFEEKFDEAEVKMHDGLAQVWAHYKARFGKPGDVQQWEGTDAFTLLKHVDQWKIASLVFRADDGGPTAK